MTFQTGQTADFEQFKVDIYCANFGQVKIGPICFFSYFGQVTIILLSLGKGLPWKSIQTLSIW